MSNIVVSGSEQLLSDDVPVWSKVDVQQDGDFLIGTLYSVVGGNPVVRQLELDTAPIRTAIVGGLLANPDEPEEVISGVLDRVMQSGAYSSEIVGSDVEPDDTDLSSVMIGAEQCLPTDDELDAVVVGEDVLIGAGMSGARLARKGLTGMSGAFKKLQKKDPKKAARIKQGAWLQKRYVGMETRKYYDVRYGMKHDRNLRLQVSRATNAWIKNRNAHPNDLLKAIRKIFYDYRVQDRKRRKTRLRSARAYLNSQYEYAPLGTRWYKVGGKKHNFPAKLTEMVVNQVPALRKLFEKAITVWASSRLGVADLKKAFDKLFKAHAGKLASQIRAVQDAYLKATHKPKKKKRGWDLFKDVVDPAVKWVGEQKVIGDVFNVVKDVGEVALEVLRSDITKGVLTVLSAIPAVQWVTGPALAGVVALDAALDAYESNAKPIVDAVSEGIKAVESAKDFGEKVKKGYEQVGKIEKDISAGVKKLGDAEKLVKQGEAKVAEVQKAIRGKKLSPKQLGEVRKIVSQVANARKALASKKKTLAKARAAADKLKSALDKKSATQLKRLEARSKRAQNAFKKIAGKARYGRGAEKEQAQKVAKILRIAAAARAAARISAEQNYGALPGIFIDAQGKMHRGRFRRATNPDRAGSGMVYRPDGTEFGLFERVAATAAQQAEDMTARNQGLESERARKKLVAIGEYMRAQRQYGKAREAWRLARQLVSQGKAITPEAIAKLKKDSSDAAKKYRATRAKVRATGKPTLAKPSRKPRLVRPRVSGDTIDTVGLDLSPYC